MSHVNKGGDPLKWVSIAGGLSEPSRSTLFSYASSISRCQYRYDSNVLQSARSDMRSGDCNGFTKLIPI